jgi:hypothetical protein
MKRLLGLTFGVTMMLLVVNAAPSAAFKTFPNASCPDTMTIFGLKTLLGGVDPCSAVTGAGSAPGDTVLGVGGIITGFDEVPTGFDVYIQMSGGGPTGGYSGIDVFTHGTNMRPVYGFNRGDSIVVEFSAVAVFNGDVELESPNNNFSSPNIKLRKVSSANPLPPFVVGNSTDLKELPTNAFFAPLVSSLVKLTGPVRVARILTNTSTSRTALLVRDAAPSDSVFIDFSKLSSVAPAAVGVYYTSISGIGNKAARGFRIMPRDGDDIVDAQPPSVVDAYAVAENAYRVLFDRAVTPATATNTGNYSLASFGSVDAAAMDGTSAVILTVSGTAPSQNRAGRASAEKVAGLLHGKSETVTVNGITGVANDSTMKTPASLSFIAGVLSCGEMSYPNPDSLAATPCRDVSRFLGSPVGSGVTGQYSNGPFGPRSTVTGIVAGIYGNLYYMEDSLPGQNRGITVFAPPQALTLGHRYMLAGADEEFFSENEYAGIAKVYDFGATSVPAPVPLTVAVAARDTCGSDTTIDKGRKYLSDLVKLTNVIVVRRFATKAQNGFHVTGQAPFNADTIFCENQNNVLGANDSNNVNYPPIGDVVDVVGCEHYTTNTSTPSFRVCPRTPADITIKGIAGVNPTPTALSFAVYPNPARTVKLDFALPKQTDVQLGVYDIVGRRIALLANGTLPAGPYHREWNGLDDRGNKVHSGVYFYRLRAGNEVRKVQSILIRD